MSSYLSKWSIGLDYQVGDADLDADGFVTAETLGGWLSGAVDAYLAQVGQLRERAVGRWQLVRRPSRQPRGGLLGPRPTDVFVTASATELRPTEFFVSVRVRAYGSGEDLPINTTCRVSIEDPRTGEQLDIGQAVRDEIVALEDAAEYMA